jgi:hypothetical protein
MRANHFIEGFFIDKQGELPLRHPPQQPIEALSLVKAHLDKKFNQNLEIFVKIHLVLKALIFL